MSTIIRMVETCITVCDVCKEEMDDEEDFELQCARCGKDLCTICANRGQWVIDGALCPECAKKFKIKEDGDGSVYVCSKKTKRPVNAEWL